MDNLHARLNHDLGKKINKKNYITTARKSVLKLVKLQSLVGTNAIKYGWQMFTHGKVTIFVHANFA